MSLLKNGLPGLVLGAFCAIGPFSAFAADGDNVRFRPLDIYIDSAAPLAAYQIEIVVKTGDGQIVGVEGGEHAAFKKAPYYDARALMGGRIILAAYSTADELPSGRARLLTVHVRESGIEVAYDVKLITAADADGNILEPIVSLTPRNGETL